MKDSIVLTRQSHIAVLTFNRPDKLNTFDQDMTDHFEALCQEINEDQTIRAVLLRGEGEVFSAGSDLHELYRKLDSFPAEALSGIRQFNACILLLREMEKLVIASVHGMVMGIGMSLLLAADLAIASENTKLALSYNRIALSPAGASSYLLPRIVGTKKALELLVMPEMIDAKEALNLGLVNWIVPHEELASRTQLILDTIANGPMVALVQTKQLMNSAWQNKLTSQLEFEAEAFVRCVNTRDFKTAVRAFVNKREPEFEGR
ncbi:enoyl-CoA hydratase/isomerase family protein [Aquicella lusitana]|uniref:2-(1,2-epoxy-1,2-dihydrophenyl)acetyl-CoA isomerase n=1 Tax=Aquicella lusitana TaxID=254246 RepID=A0A370GYS8_9COXI|nr:enoyl-CoA hydratase-related protein [Aquicella lusitana]RDI48813.1 2-(1,2-epoxy-1,2-dihydrophenyl)acetyl-CoA isomerase [Aquicella lusitana]VVC73241.1 Short-chain-enoyl-CoA hydratase [Aquicella lusitana]